MKNGAAAVLIFAALLISARSAFSHCDTMEGPVVTDAKMAFEKNNVNYVLKWVMPDNENDVRQAFGLAMKVRPLGAEAKELSEKYFFDLIVRVHRAGEGVPFTGVRPYGVPVDEKIKAADRSIATGSLAPLARLVPKEKMPELETLFARVMALKNFDVNDVRAGRRYIEAYVRFFHTAEGEAEGHGHHHHGEGRAHMILTSFIVLTVIFFFTTILFVALWLKKKK